MTRRASAGEIRERDGLLLYAGATPSAFLINAGLRLDDRLGPEEVIARAAAFFGERRHRWELVARADTDTDLDALCRVARGRCPAPDPRRRGACPLRDGFPVTLNGIGRASG